MTEAVTLRAFAKINWGLELLGKRADGYREIRTVTHTVSLCDDLRVEPASGGIHVTVQGDWPAPTGDRNICWRAAEAFMRRFGKPAGVRVHLNKRIPPAAGLGGGSSDAVATLAALARLTGVADAEALADLARGLGSDTALFLTGGAALCSGRGEVVCPFACPRTYYLVLAKPDCSVATPEAYGLIAPQDFTDGSCVAALAARLAAGAEPDFLCGSLCNAFRRAVGEQYPEIGGLISAVNAAGAVAQR